MNVWDEGSGLRWSEGFSFAARVFVGVKALAFAAPLGVSGYSAKAEAFTPTKTPASTLFSTTGLTGTYSGFRLDRRRRRDRRVGVKALAFARPSGSPVAPQRLKPSLQRRPERARHRANSRGGDEGGRPPLCYGTDWDVWRVMLRVTDAPRTTCWSEGFSLCRAFGVAGCPAKAKAFTPTKTRASATLFLQAPN